MKTYRLSHLNKGITYDQEIRGDCFDAYMAKHEEEFIQKAIPKLFPYGIPNYLDFACGTGRITAAIEPYADCSFGVDVSDRMQEIAKRKCKKTAFFLQDITTSPLPVEEVDLVTAFRFFGNAEMQLRRDVLQTLNAHMKQGAMLILNNHRNPYSIALHIERLLGDDSGADLTPQILDQLLNEYGFKTCFIHGIGLWLIHHRLKREALLNSSVMRFLEHMSQFYGAYRYCLDYVVVAQKVSDAV